jgi:hypothetical protein
MIGVSLLSGLLGNACKREPPNTPIGPVLMQPPEHHHEVRLVPATIPLRPHHSTAFRSL